MSATDVYLAQVSIPYFTAIPKDVVTNTWHFQWVGVGSPSTSDYNNLRDDLKAFYQPIYTTPNSMACYARPLLTTIKIYDLIDTVPRIPRYTSAMALTVTLDTTTTTLAAETAVCLSYKATPLAGIPLASLRGRIYLGALGAGVTGPGATNAFPSPTSVFRTALKNGAINLITALATHNWIWVVYSRSRDQSHASINGFIDDAYDTQRRRGQGATTRTLWP